MITLTRKYTPEEQHSIYNSMIDYTKQRFEVEKIDINDVYSGAYNFETAENFGKAYRDVARMAKAICSGKKGETLAYNSLRILDYNSKVLKTVQTPSYNPELSVEHDIIVITEKAIFTIEVKNINDPRVVITEQGVMIKESSTGELRVGKNVVQQLRWHQTSLIKLLKGTRFEKVRVVPVLMFTNDMCTFENRFASDKNTMGFRCCYRATADRILLDSAYTDCLSSEDMSEIEQILKSASEAYAPRKFDLCIGVKEYTEILEAFVNEVKEERKCQEKLSTCGVDEIRMYLSNLLVSHNTNNN